VQVVVVMMVAVAPGPPLLVVMVVMMGVMMGSVGAVMGVVARTVRVMPDPVRMMARAANVAGAVKAAAERAAAERAVADAMAAAMGRHSVAAVAAAGRSRGGHQSSDAESGRRHDCDCELARHWVSPGGWKVNVITCPLVVAPREKVHG
jgi:hypothetical protein